MADNLEFGVSLRLDVAQIARATSQMAAQFATVLNTNQQVAQSFGRVGDKASRAYTEAENAAQQFNRASRAGGNLAEELANDLEAVTRTARATRATLESVGADPQLFAVAERELQRVLQLQTRFNAEFERISRDPNLLRGYVQEFEQIRTPLSKSVSNLNELLRSTARERGQIQARETLQLRAELDEQLAVRKAANSKFVVEGQRETTLRNAEIRTQGQLTLQQERRTARTRIEILRFTLQQVRVMERAIGAVARGTAVIVAGAYARIEGAVGRLGQVFRRSNRSIDDGLQGALTAREQRIRSSFQRQTNDVRVSVNQQSAQLDRLEQKLSTGVFGAASGRSRLGGALGIGGIIGGGVGARSLLTAGFDRFANLERITNQLERLTGSAENGAALMAEIDAFARTTPLALDTVAQMSVGFLSMGVAAEDVVPNVNAIADAIGFTAGGAEQLERVGLALRQIASTGKLQGDEFNQLAENLPGLNINQLLADQLTGGDQAALVQLRSSGELTADIFLEAFITGLREDPRIAGSMTDIADQLSGQVSNLKAAWARLGATIITEAIVPIRFGIATMRRIFSDLAKFIAGDVSPQLQVLRQALIGIAGALGLLLAAKVAAESIGLLGTALRFALTPMGLLVVTVAAVGAALRIFSTSSEGFADTLRGVLDAARTVGGDALGILVRNLQRLGDVIRVDLFPVLQPLIDTVGGALFRALEVSIGFIALVAIPAFIQLGNAIGENFLPAVSAVGGVLQRTVVPALVAFAGAALSVLSTVVEFLQPAIDGFLRLGDSIVQAFADRDFGGLLGGLRSVAVGIGNVFRDLGVLLYNAIRPQVERAVGFIVSTFQSLDLGAIGRKILEIVRLVGFILGSIVSDPRFVTALAGIVAAAALVAANFVIGFAEGVRSNLPELGRLLGDAFEAALSEAFSDKTRLAKIIAAGLAAIFAAQAILGAWTAAGKAGAGGMAKGFATGIGRGAINTPNVVRALFGGEDAISAAFAAAGKKQAAAYNKSYNATLRDFRRLNIEPQRLVTGDVSAFNVADIRRQFQEVEKALGSATVGARLFRDRASEFVRGFGQTARGVAIATSGEFRLAWRDIQQGSARMSKSVVDGFNRMRAQGRLSGQALGGAVLAGFGAAISGQQGGALGIAGILAASLGALAVTGPLVAGAVAGIGAISFVMGRNKRAAEEAAAAVDGYAEAVQRAFQNANTVAEAEAAIAEDIVDSLLELDKIEKTLLSRAGFDASAFVSAALDGVGAVEAINEGFRGLDFAANFGDLDEGKTIIEALTRAYDGAQQGMRDAALRQDVLAGVFARSNREAAAAEFAYDRVGVGVANLGGRAEEAVFSFDRVSGALADLAGATRRTGEDAVGGAGRFVRAFGSIDDAIREFAGNLNLQRAFDFDLSAFLDGLSFGVDQSSFAFDRIGIAVGSLNRELEKTKKIKINVLGGDKGDPGGDEQVRKVNLITAAVQELNRQRTSAIQAEIKRVQSRLDEATKAAEEARAALTAFITGRYADTAQAQVDNLIGSLGNIGSAIEGALVQGGVRGEAALRSAVGGFESALAGIIQAGFDDGLRTQEQFRSLLAPLFAAVDEETGDAASRILSNVDFEAGFSPQAAAQLSQALDRVLGGDRLEVGVQGILDAEANQRSIQNQLDQLQNSLDVDVAISPAQVRQALIDAFNQAGVPLSLVPNVDGAAIAAAQQTGLVSAAAQYGDQNNSVEQTNNFNVNIVGSKSPEETTSEFMNRVNAGVVGLPIIITSGGGNRVPLRTNVVTQS